MEPKVKRSIPKGTAEFIASFAREFNIEVPSFKGTSEEIPDMIRVLHQMSIVLDRRHTVQMARIEIAITLLRDEQRRHHGKA